MRATSFSWLLTCIVALESFNTFKFRLSVGWTVRQPTVSRSFGRLVGWLVSRSVGQSFGRSVGLSGRRSVLSSVGWSRGPCRPERCNATRREISCIVSNGTLRTSRDATRRDFQSDATRRDQNLLLVYIAGATSGDQLRVDQ